jgi:hypothetical protein
MIIDMGLEESFLAPEGRFQGTCTEVREIDKRTKKGLQPVVRIVFDLDIVEEGVQYRVGRDFPTSDLKGIKEVLKDWLGKGVNGKKLDLQTLRTQRATLEVVHIPPRDEHEEAYRYVNRILPPAAQTPDPSLN